MTAYAAAYPELGPKPTAPVVDAALHVERISADGGQASWRDRLGSLPDGTMVAVDDAAWLVWRRRLLKWSPEGYVAGAAIESDQLAVVLTPPSTVGALRQGYVPVLHPSADAF